VVYENFTATSVAAATDFKLFEIARIDAALDGWTTWRLRVTWTTGAAIVDRMARLRPGWLVVLCAGVLAVSVWLPWLTSRADGAGVPARSTGSSAPAGNRRRGSVSGTIVLLASSLIVAGAMARAACSAECIERGTAFRCAFVLTMWYYRLYGVLPVSRATGLPRRRGGGVGDVLSCGRCSPLSVVGGIAVSSSPYR